MGIAIKKWNCGVAWIILCRDEARCVLTAVPYDWDPDCPWYNWAEDNCKSAPDEGDLKASVVDYMDFVGDTAYGYEVMSFVAYVGEEGEVRS